MQKNDGNFEINFPLIFSSRILASPNGQGSQYRRQVPTGLGMTRQLPKLAKTVLQEFDLCRHEIRFLERVLLPAKLASQYILVEQIFANLNICLFPQNINNPNRYKPLKYQNLLLF